MLKLMFYKGNKYVIVDCDKDELINKIVEVDFFEFCDIDQYFYYDEKGVLYCSKTGGAVGLMEVK